MHRAGFVLAGGLSTRMGRDKALLTHGAGTLVETVAKVVSEAVQNVALIGDPRKYGWFGYPVYPDCLPGCGPMGGLHTALSLQLAEWNLIVACDMPKLTTVTLTTLLDRTESVGNPRLACVVPLTSSGDFEPLCAVYHSSCLPAIERALSEKQFKMRALLSKLKTVGLDGWPSPVFSNINTLEEWTDLKRDTGP